MQPYWWMCANCGFKAEESIDACPKCGNRIWGKINRIQKLDPNQAKILGETPSAFTQPITKLPKEDLARVANLINSIECSACNSIIYTPKGKFDQETFKANEMKHYSESPSCKPIPK
jgi:predicted ATP-dependent serine protease